MNKLLKIEVVVLAVLVIVAVCVSLDFGGGSAQTLPTEPTGDIVQATVSDDPSKSTESEPPATETQPTEPPATEPEIELTFAESFSVESRDYFVYDCTRDKMLAVSGELDKKVYPASVTKLFTAYVALQYLDPETVVTAGKEVNMVAADSSIAYIKVGHKLTVAQLVEGMLLPSGNDAAYCIAVAAARAESGDSGMSASDALTYFVGLMNAKAQELGMTGTHFNNPDGYHDFEHYTCIGDLPKIAEAALSNELIRQCASTPEDRVTYASGEIATWKNTNQLINPDSQYYCENAIGLKTGNTSYAGFCLLSAYEVEGEYYVIGAFGCQRPEDRFIDSLKLFEVLMEALEGTSTETS